MKGVTEHKRGDYNVLEIDTKVVEHQHVPWRLLGDFGKRKFENLLYIEYGKTNPKFIYI